MSFIPYFKKSENPPGTTWFNRHEIHLADNQKIEEKKGYNNLNSPENDEGNNKPDQGGKRGSNDGTESLKVCQ